MARRIFMTGATGVVGELLVPLLVARGDHVTAIGRTPAKRTRLERAGAQPVEVSLFDDAALRRAVDGHDVVINLATHMPSSTFRMLLPWSWRENDRIRRDASALLVDASLATGIRCFVQESFAPIYEDGGKRWIEETWPVRPAPYNRTVLDAERSAARFTERGGVGIVVRFAGFYGDDAMTRDMRKIAGRGWAPLPGRADAYWSSIRHDDAAAAVAAVLAAPAGAYNVCDDEPLNRRQVADAFAASVGASSPRLMPRWLTALGGSTMELLSRSQRMSNRKLRTATGWEPRWRSMREGLAASPDAPDAPRPRRSPPGAG